MSTSHLTDSDTSHQIPTTASGLHLKQSISQNSNFEAPKRSESKRLKRNPSQFLLLRSIKKKQKMKSLDITNEQIKISFPKRTLIKNSSSSSQMNIRSSKKMLIISNSHKNSELFSIKIKKVSTESLQSFSLQKMGLDQSAKYSNKKNFKYLKNDFPKEFQYRYIKGKGYKNDNEIIFKIKESSNTKVPSSTQQKCKMGIKYLEKNKRFRSVKKSLIVQSVNSIHKNSQNNLIEEYLSTPFNPSSQNMSTDQSSFPDSNHKKHFSNLSINQEIKKIQNLQNKNHFLLSQKYLDIHQNKKSSKIKEKRIKSQMQMHNPENTTNFISINRINKDTKDSLKMKDQYRQEVSNNFKSIKNHYDTNSVLTIQEKPEVKDDPITKFSEKNLYFDDSNLQNEELKIDKSLRLNDEDFFYEQIGNIYCKKIEDYCQECLRILDIIKIDCESCYSSLKTSKQSKERRVSENSNKNHIEMSLSNNTCINCWNKLSNYTDKCTQCNEEIEKKSKSITFGNQILIKKKSSINEIGETLIDLDEKIISDYEDINQEDIFSKKKSKNTLIKQVQDSQQKEDSLWIRGDGNKKDLCIHIPVQEFSIKDSENKSQKKKFK